MKVYLASPWGNREATRIVRSDLAGMGWQVTSRWLDAPDGPSLPDRELGITGACMDLEDIAAAEVLVVLTDERPIGAGHHVELGYALALGKRIFVVGPVKSVFHYLAEQRFETWPQMQEWLHLKAST